MGYTSAQRNSLSTPLCKAKKKNGELCRAFAGQGTDHLRIGRCKYHGGSTASHRQHATAIEAQRQMIVLSDVTERDPHGTLLEMHNRAHAQTRWAEQRIKNMTPEDHASPEGQTFLKMYFEERERLGRIAEVCVKAGVQIKMLEIQEAQTVILVQWFDAVLSRLNLNEKQLDAIPAALDAAAPFLEGRARELPKA
jgi:hypothetical protein